MQIMKYIPIFLAVFNFYCTNAVKTCSSWPDYWNFFGANSCRENLDSEDQFPIIVGRWGKTVETYEIRTYDGYILTLYRILPNNKNAPPVLLLHGIFMNSLAFVNRGKKSLAHQFVKMGYDVWVLNWRGTKYSRGHIALDVKKTTYWKFSSHELGIYDLRRALKEIKKMNEQKVLLVGFEMGNTAAFIYATMYPEEANERLSGMVSLSPTGVPINIGFQYKIMLYSYALFWKYLLQYLYHGEVPAVFQSIRATIFCRHGGILFARFCDAHFMSATGLDIMQQDPDTLPVIVALNKDSNSLMTFEHAYQMMRDRKFQMFDYGEEINVGVYGKKSPTEYDLSKLNVPQLFFVGKNDKAGNVQDATVMYQHIPEQYRREFHVIEHEKFGLADFVQAKDVNNLLHEYLITCVTKLVPPVPPT